MINHRPRRRTTRPGAVVKIDDDGKNRSKVDRLIHHFYSKTTQVILEARLINTTENPRRKKPRYDRWFNLEFDEPEYFKLELKTWKSISSILLNPHPSPSSDSIDAFHLIPILLIETILDLQRLPPDLSISLIDSLGNHTLLVHPSTPHKNIVLERWSLSLFGPLPTHSNLLEPPTVYRHATIHFRALYSFLRTMPVSSLLHHLHHHPDPRASLLEIGSRISASTPDLESQPIPPPHPLNSSSTQEIPLSHPFHPKDSIETFDFPSIQTSLGSLRTRVSFRNQVDLRIIDHKTTLSSRPQASTSDRIPTRPRSSLPNPTPSNLPHHPIPPSLTTLEARHDPISDDRPRSIKLLPPQQLSYRSTTTSPSRTYLSTDRRSSSTCSDHHPLGSQVVRPTDSITAEILAATQSSPFPPTPSPRSPNRHAHHSTTSKVCVSSADRKSVV